MQIIKAQLEDWMRDYYFSTEIDIGSSGVENFSLAEIRELVGLDHLELDRVVFNDSPTYGDYALREVIARRWGDGNPEKVMVTNGSSEALFLDLNVLVERGRGDRSRAVLPRAAQYGRVG